MMRYLFVLAMIVFLGEAQRSPYAGTPDRYPVVLPQYIKERQDAAVASGISLGSRLGNNASTSTTSTTTTVPPNLPVDARGDVDLVNRIKTWPREKQPFWYLNWQQIQEHRGGNPADKVQTQVNSRSFFAANRSL
ncbi:uncharacterized protein LOC107271252 [Cephus cinctus]|uniref:Uncharacterized protein LOC107271252 n=1 Tax=Cephus cinctus TaxID=211228 RepID=A0AAJ7FPX2_CEPCN|nr:uncharacterized protein LOC107271252 [Cephus cinctus]